MIEGTEEEPRRQPEEGHPAADDDTGAVHGDELGRAKADYTPPIDADEQEEGQTEHAAPEDDVGTS